MSTATELDGDAVGEVEFEVQAKDIAADKPDTQIGTGESDTDLEKNVGCVLWSSVYCSPGIGHHQL